MENMNSAPDKQLISKLAQQVEICRADLVGSYLGVLRETLFSNRAEVRPSMLKQIAADEAEMFLAFLNQPAFSAAEHGSQLYRTGLSERVILRLGHVTRLFFLANLESNQITPMLETVDAYQEAVIHGFVQELEKYYLSEVERTRNTLQRYGS
jgi:hypothetical protein